jgi:hypothetical protein
MLCKEFGGNITKRESHWEHRKGSFYYRISWYTRKAADLARKLPYPHYSLGRKTKKLMEILELVG